MTDRIVNVRLTIDEEPMRVLWEDHLEESADPLTWEQWVEGWITDIVGEMCKRDVYAEIVP